MYSRYKIRMPAPPPDYTGTAFQTDPMPIPIGTPIPENPTVEEQSVNTRKNPGGSVQENRQDARRGGEQGIPPVILPQSPQDRPESLDPGFTIPPEAGSPPPEEDAAEEEKGEDECPASKPKPHDQAPQSDPAPDAGSSGSLLAEMNPDDLLFIGAMLYLLSGKTGDDSFLLMAYLLTCGL